VTGSEEDYAAARYELAVNFSQYWGDPLWLVPVGWRERDVSLNGVADVAMNPLELLMPNPAHRPFELGWKPYPAYELPLSHEAPVGWKNDWREKLVGRTLQNSQKMEMWIAPERLMDMDQRKRFYQQHQGLTGFRCAR
jgi:hypothetical protein